jgi:hypothetical protein
MTQFGVRRVPLPKEQFMLDEDGWVDVLTRPSVRLALAAQVANETSEAAQIRMWSSYVRGWSIKADGVALVYAADSILDLPTDILEAVSAELQKLPLRRQIPSGAPLNGSAPVSN